MKTRVTGTVAELMSPVARLASDSDGSIKKTGLTYIKIGLSYVKIGLSNYARLRFTQTNYSRWRIAL